MAGYIGNVPVPQSTQTRDTFTATAGQTSFATSGYTPNFLDVYLNGVKLPAEDFTATNGTDVVLDTGAAADDILEVVAFTTFEVQGDINSDSVTTGTFTSNGIDDNATSTAMTLDSSGNLHVGKTSTSTSTVGTTLLSNGRVTHTAASDSAVELNRTTSDGAIINFRKDNSTVGSIGTIANYMTAGTSDSAILFHSGEDNIQPWNMSTNSGRDAGISLGAGNNRFKDLYLSGGVYLGGTGSANKLDDYEEGTWTPTDESGASLSFTVNNSAYVKVGQLVTISLELSFPTTSSIASAEISLPFAPAQRTGHAGFSNRAGETNVYASLVDGTLLLYNDTGARLDNADMSAKYIITDLSYITS